MNALRKILIIIFLGLTMIHCKEPEPYVITCVDGVVPYSDTGGFNKIFSFKDDKPGFNEQSLVIQSQIEFNSYLDPTSFGNSPQIDFNSKTLLVGRLSSPFDTGFFSQEVVSDCGKKVIDYNVKLYKGGSATAGVTHFYAVIPKISEETKVRFNVTVKE